MPPVRRLTVLQDTSADDDRPSWQWIPIGVLFAISTWAPLAMLAVWVSQSLVHRVPSRLLLWIGVTAPPLITFAFSCWGAGALVGRFGGNNGPRQTAIVGALAALAACAVAVLVGANASTSLAALAVLLPLGVGGGWLGGRWGVRRRTVSATRAAPPAAH